MSLFITVNLAPLKPIPYALLNFVALNVFSCVFKVVSQIVNFIYLKTLLCRMMGFGEEEGVIPRFCQELFSRLASMENEEVNSLFE